MIAISTDIFGPSSVPAIHIYKVPDLYVLDESASANRKIQDDLKKNTIDMFHENGNYTRILWTDCNSKLLTSSNDGYMRLFDVETGKIVNERQIHYDLVNDMQKTADESFVITASSDETAKLVDVQNLEVVFTYQMDRPCQSAAVSPIYNHVLLAGGQEASKVTTTSQKAGGFENRFFHKIFGYEFARVQGHNSTVNSVAFSPDGKSFVTGGEEGFVRLHHFDQEYFDLTL